MRVLAKAIIHIASVLNTVAGVCYTTSGGGGLSVHCNALGLIGIAAAREQVLQAAPQLLAVQGVLAWKVLGAAEASIAWR
jgi:hypothetical protein